jgi:hypothetical protein
MTRMDLVEKVQKRIVYIYKTRSRIICDINQELVDSSRIMTEISILKCLFRNFVPANQI